MKRSHFGERPKMGVVESGGRIFSGRFRSVRVMKRGLGIETLLGVDLVHGGEVVIKTASAVSVSLSVRLRLEHEAQVLRQLRTASLDQSCRRAFKGKPSIPPLIQVGQEDDLFYLVMPYIPGVTLRERLERGALSVRDAVTVGRSVLTALEEAHGCGVLHRDVKPSNIIVDEGGPLKRASLIDFGLSRSERLEPMLRDVPVGTVRYISPEQAGMLDREVDARSDLYSLGVVLYESLSGRPPFEAGEVGELLRQHLTVEPPKLPGEGIPRALEELIGHLLRKDPRDRYQSAGGVLADLEEIVRALERGVAEPVVVIGRHDR
ncbi:MAG TPA: serine/threonine-protein kinase, partial [Nitrospiria bacterium]|nr:serine/threonine-protein kinase [Nitrospiria bacterium]